MDPFSITCTTCKTRLKVRDESAIGQILACPKCGGLVMVKPPDDPTSAASDSAETRPDISTIAPRPVVTYRPGDTLPATNFEDIDSILSDAPPRPRDPLPGGGSKKARVSINDAAGQSAITLTGASGVRKAAAKGSADVQDSPKPGQQAGSSSTILPATLPSNEGSSLSGKNGSKVGKTASGIRKTPVSTTEAEPAAVATQIQPEGSGSAIGASATSDSTAGAPSPYPFAGDAAVAPPEAVAKSGWWHWPLITAAIGAGMLLAVTVVYVSFTLLNDTATPIVQRTTQQISAADSAAPDKSNSANKADKAPATTPTETTTEPEAPDTQSPAAAEDTTEATPSDEPADEAVATTKQPQPEKQPEGEDPLGILAPPAADNGKPAETKVADPLAGFGKLIDAPTADPIPLEQSATTSTLDLPPEEAATGSASRPTLPRPEPRNVDVAARLADPLPAIEVSGVPLVDYLHFVQDLSTIPITLQPDSLWFARATPTSHVNTTGQNVSVGAALANGLKPLGLESTAVDGQLVVGLIEPSPLPKIQYPVKDLTAGDEQRAIELGEWMQSLVQPQSWGEGLGSLIASKDTIATQQKRAVHADLLQLFEKLRVARGLKPLSRFDRANFSLETRLTRAKPKLDTPITLNFSQPALLTRIAERLEEAAQVKILVDWQSLASAGWNPDGEATLLVENKPFSEALTQLTERMNLTWRAVDATTFQILTPQAAQEKLDLEFYPLVEALSATTAADEGEALIARLRATLGEEHFREAGGRCDLRYDAESKYLLASLPQVLQKKLVQALAELQTGPTMEIK